jgi:hypothetical protein
MAYARGVAEAAVVLLLLSAGGCAIPIIGATARDDRDQAETRAEQRRGGAHDLGPPSRLVLAEHDPEACDRALAAEGIAFERVHADEAPGVRVPVRLLGPLDGVQVTAQGKGHVHAILDCRLALALLTWAPTLRRAGITRIEHYSMYRPGARVGGSGHESGHAHGLAIDAARFYLQNGTALDVLTDWEERDRGGAPCPRRREEGWPSRLLRGVVCDAVDHKLFQIVITPHHDHAHGNHVHLELKPEVSWTYVR